MKSIYLKDENHNWKLFTYTNLSELDSEFKRLNITVGEGATVGEWATVGSRAKVGEGATVGIYNAMFALNLYKYAVSAYNSDGVDWVQLGCYLRKREDWDKDFWNNNSEFPNDNSDKSNARLRAYKIACAFLDSIKTK